MARGIRDALAPAGVAVQIRTRRDHPSPARDVPPPGPERAGPVVAALAGAPPGPLEPVRAGAVHDQLLHDQLRLQDQLRREAPGRPLPLDPHQRTREPWTPLLAPIPPQWRALTARPPNAPGLPTRFPGEGNCSTAAVVGPSPPWIFWGVGAGSRGVDHGRRYAAVNAGGVYGVNVSRSVTVVTMSLRLWVGRHARRIADRWDPQPRVALILSPSLTPSRHGVTAGYSVRSTGQAGDQTLRDLRLAHLVSPVVTPRPGVRLTGV